MSGHFEFLPDDVAGRIAEALADGAKLLPLSIAKIDSCFCGCGDPEAAWGWVLTYLLGLKLHAPPNEPESGAEWVAIYLMDHLGMTEHGSCLHGAWLTDSGEEALAFLVEHGSGWQESNSAGWIDAAGVYRVVPQ